jgi:hypothetical protein
VIEALQEVKMIERNRNESGQAIVMLVVALVVLLGFLALAIDGGMAYSDRRHAQNAADASALAGGGSAALSLENSYYYYNGYNNGGWSCSHSKVLEAEEAAREAAIARASSNSFGIDDDIADLHGVTTNCENFYNGAWNERYIEVTTYISNTTETHFAQLIYNGDVRNNVLATSRIYPRTPTAFGNAIVALNPNCGANDGIKFAGNEGTWVYGGGIFSNGCLQCSGSAGGAFAEPPHNIHYVSTVHGCTEGTNISPAPSQASMSLPPAATYIPEPTLADCDGLGAVKHTGTYLVTNGQAEVLEPNKLHCFMGSPVALRVNGGELTGVGVTLYVPNTTSSIEVTGGTVHLYAPQLSPDPAPAIPRVLIYSNGDVSLSGNGDSVYEGTIYAPLGDIYVSGNSATQAFNSQLVGLNVTIAGTARVEVYFNNNQNYSRPSLLELFK